MEEQLWYDRYRPLELITANNGTEVYLVEHSAIKERRIIKRADAGTEAAEILQREAELLRKLPHSSAPQLYDVIVDELGTALIEEYIEGESLQEYIDRKRELNLKQFVNMVRSVCEVLIVMHRAEQTAYCDLHPGNLIVTGKGLRLIDFGAAMSIGRTGMCQSAFGTAEYGAPELFKGEMCTEAVDVFSVGKIMLQLLEIMQQNENSGCSSGKLRRYRRIAEKATKKNVSERYETVQELLVDFERSRAREKSQKGLRHIQGTVCTVGVMGIFHGVGTTHTALAAANYLCNVANKRVALVEMSESKDLLCLRKASKKGEGDLQQKPCRLAGFNVFPAADSLLAGVVRNGNYDYCIFDLGCASGYRMQEFLRCDKKLIITDVAPWRQDRREKLDSVLSQTETPDGWTVLFNFSSHERPKDCRGLAVKTDFRNFSPDPFEATEQDEILFEKLLSAF